MYKHTPIFFPEDSLRHHAKVLRNSLPLSLGQCQEMIAYSYNCSSWGELIKQVLKSKGDRDDYELSLVGRERLQTLMDSGWDDQIDLVKNLHLIPNTISYAVSRKRLDWLLDYEIIQLYSRVFEGCEEPIYSFYEALQGADNNMLTQFYLMRANGCIREFLGANEYRHILEDPRFGLKIYYNFFETDNNVTIILREVDSSFNNPDFNDQLCNRPWFVSYIAAYISRLHDQLKEFFSSVEIVLHRVNSMDVVNWDSISSYYKDRGAVETFFFGTRKALRLNLSDNICIPV